MHQCSFITFWSITDMKQDYVKILVSWHYSPLILWNQEASWYKEEHCMPSNILQETCNFFDKSISSQSNCQMLLASCENNFIFEARLECPLLGIKYFLGSHNLVTFSFRIIYSFNLILSANVQLSIFWLFLPRFLMYFGAF